MHFTSSNKQTAVDAAGGDGGAARGPIVAARALPAAHRPRVALLTAAAVSIALLTTVAGVGYNTLRVEGAGGEALLGGLILTFALGGAGLALCALALAPGAAAAVLAPGVLMLGQAAAAAAGLAAFALELIVLASGEARIFGVLVAVAAAGVATTVLASAVVAVWSGWWAPPAWPEPLAAACGPRAQARAASLADAVGLPLAIAAGAGIVTLCAGVSTFVGGTLGVAGETGTWQIFAPALGAALVQFAATIAAAAACMWAGGAGRLAAVALLAAIGPPYLATTVDSASASLLAGIVLMSGGAAAAIVGLGVMPKTNATPALLTRGQCWTVKAFLCIAGVGLVPSAAGLGILGARDRAAGKSPSDGIMTAGFNLACVAAAGMYGEVVSSGGLGARAAAAGRHRLAAAGVLLYAAPDGLVEAMTAESGAEVAHAAGCVLQGVGCIGAACALATVIVPRGRRGDAKGTAAGAGATMA